MKHHNEWLPRNAIGASFDGEGYEEFGGAKGRKYLLSFKVVAMGDLNAVDISQQVHLEVLKDCHCMCDNEVLQFGAPIPASQTLLKNSRTQYDKHSIPTSAKKAFSKADRYVAWGTEVDSKTGRVGTPQWKLYQLSQLIAKACELKTVA